MDRSVYDNMRAVERDHWWFKARREILRGEIGRLGLAPGARILEVGCGTGGNLQMLSSFGDVVGLEPDEASRQYAEESNGVPVVSGFLPAPLPALGDPFDMIAALDVIEHLEDDQGSVEALAGLLKPGAKMLTTVPAYPWMWSEHDVLHHHKRRYRRGEYVGLFRKVGLRIIRASYFNSLLFPPIALARLFGLPKGGGADAVPTPSVNNALTMIFASERKLLSVTDLPFGVSILLTAEKPALP